MDELTVRKFLASFRKSANRQYAADYLAWLESGGLTARLIEPCRPKEVSSMVAQAIRWRVHELTQKVPSHD